MDLTEFRDLALEPSGWRLITSKKFEGSSLDPDHEPAPTVLFRREDLAVTMRIVQQDGWLRSIDDPSLQYFSHSQLRRWQWADDPKFYNEYMGGKMKAARLVADIQLYFNATLIESVRAFRLNNGSPMLPMPDWRGTEELRQNKRPVLGRFAHDFIRVRFNREDTHPDFDDFVAHCNYDIVDD